MAWPGEAMPRMYAILDAEAVAARGGELLAVAGALRRAGVALLQYRDKLGTDEAVLANARATGEVFRGSECTLILNDRAELVREAGWDGVHLGQGDMEPGRARVLLGEGLLIGLSTHTLAQAMAAELDRAVDYVALGPIFSTATKRDAEAVVGLAGLAEVRSAVHKPLVAIGGVSGERIAPVLAAGVDAIAFISALFIEVDDVERRTRALIEQLEHLHRGGARA